MAKRNQSDQVVEIIASSFFSFFSHLIYCSKSATFLPKDCTSVTMFEIIKKKSHFQTLRVKKTMFLSLIFQLGNKRGDVLSNFQTLCQVYYMPSLKCIHFLRWPSFFFLTSLLLLSKNIPCSLVFFSFTESSMETGLEASRIEGGNHCCFESTNQR